MYPGIFRNSNNCLIWHTLLILISKYYHMTISKSMVFITVHDTWEINKYIKIKCFNCILCQSRRWVNCTFLRTHKHWKESHDFICFRHLSCGKARNNVEAYYHTTVLACPQWSKPMNKHKCVQNILLGSATRDFLFCFSSF